MTPYRIFAGSLATLAFAGAPPASAEPIKMVVQMIDGQGVKSFINILRGGQQLRKVDVSESGQAIADGFKCADQLTYRVGFNSARYYVTVNDLSCQSRTVTFKVKRST